MLPENLAARIRLVSHLLILRVSRPIILSPLRLLVHNLILLSIGLKLLRIDRLLILRSPGLLLLLH